MINKHTTNLIDFNYASTCWRANKKYLGKGIFSYKCNHISKTTNKYCTNKIYSHSYCKFHFKNINKN